MHIRHAIGVIEPNQLFPLNAQLFPQERGVPGHSVVRLLPCPNAAVAGPDAFFCSGQASDVVEEVVEQGDAICCCSGGGSLGGSPGFVDADGVFDEVEAGVEVGGRGCGCRYCCCKEVRSGVGGERVCGRETCLRMP